MVHRNEDVVHACLSKKKGKSSHASIFPQNTAQEEHVNFFSYS